MIYQQLKAWYRRANRLSGRRLSILKNTLVSFSDVRASQAAASLAYYAILSLFPLLLVLIAGGSYFLESEQVYQGVNRIVQSAIPVQPGVISENLRQVMEARGTVGIIGLLILLWSASGFFTSLAYNINLAWHEASRRNFLQKRLVGLGMIAGLCGLLVISLVLDWVIGLIPFLNSRDASSHALNGWRRFSSLGAWLAIFLLFAALYHWVPTQEVHWKATFWGALTASIGWETATAGFGWYLQSGLGRYQLVYGSLGAMMALLFLIFVTSLIILFGAHLSAAIDQWEEEKAK